VQLLAAGERVLADAEQVGGIAVFGTGELGSEVVGCQQSAAYISEFPGCQQSASVYISWYKTHSL
jgi:hypothetical protein